MQTRQARHSGLYFLRLHASVFSYVLHTASSPLWSVESEGENREVLDFVYERVDVGVVGTSVHHQVYPVCHTVATVLLSPTTRKFLISWYSQPLHCPHVLRGVFSHRHRCVNPRRRVRNITSPCHALQLPYVFFGPHFLKLGSYA